MPMVEVVEAAMHIQWEEGTVSLCHPTILVIMSLIMS
jgi:hypothetical protein